MPRSAASLDRLLAILVATEAATGLLTLGAGSPSLGWVFVAHGLVSGALLWAIVLKLRRSLPRAVATGRHVRVAIGLAVAFVALAALLGGFGWVASGRLVRAGPWTVLTLHAWAGLVLLPILAIHLLPRRWRLLRAGPDALPAAGRRLMSRRALLTAVAFAGVSVALYSAADLLDRALGGERRFTGSRPLPSGGIPPSTTFLGEATPTIDEAFRVRVVGRVHDVRTWSIADLAALAQVERTATLDCTSGWAMTTTWRGVPLSTLLEAAAPAAGAAWVDVRSITGWSTHLTLEQANSSLLATGVSARALAAENGAPCRLVVPDRRGVDWVKWVAEIEVS